MKAPMVNELREGQSFQRALFAVSQLGVQQARNGEPFLYMRLQDRTDAVDARQFARADLPDFAPGDVVQVTGSYTTRYGIRVEEVEPYSGLVSIDDFLPLCPRDAGQMGRELRGLVETISEPHLRALVGEFFSDAWEDFRKWPGAQEVHHAYVGGLLEHTLAVLRLVDTYSGLYEVNRDRLVVGGLFHDMGKLDELACRATIIYTDAGHLFGHTYLGTKRLERYASRVASFPEGLRDQLCHMILSHHGNAEWGAVVPPMTLEAFLLHIADYTDTKAHRYGKIASEQRKKGLAFGQWDRFLRTRVYSPDDDTES